MTNLLVCGVVIHCLSMTLFQTPRYIFLQYGSEHNPAKKTKKNYKMKSVSLTSRVNKCRFREIHENNRTASDS